MVRETVDKVVKGDLCTSCGVCAGACHIGCIAFSEGRERSVPAIDHNECMTCGICYDVCPGKGIELNNLSEKLFSKEPSIRKDSYAGYFLYTYVGHSTDDNVRIHCASGGMVTQFLMWLLEKGKIEGAVVVRFKKDDPLVPEPIIATTKEELWDSRSSKYIVLSHNNVAKEVATGKYKKIVVVGLPCQIQGWRLLAEKNKKVKESIKGFFAIYCSVNKTKLSMEYYLKRYEIDSTKVSRFAFRDDGCMGFMKFEDKRGETIRKIPYKDYWFGSHSFFTNPRCLMCIDQMGELADISFGDIHIKPYSDDVIGTNSIITRSSYWDVLLKECKEERAVTLDEIPIETLVRSQIFCTKHKKGAGGKAYIKIKQLFGKNIPLYDYSYEGGVSFMNYIIASYHMFMHAVGKRKCLWWIVRILDRSKNHTNTI